MELGTGWERGYGVQRRFYRKMVKFPMNTANGTAKSDIGRDSRRGDFECCNQIPGWGQAQCDCGTSDRHSATTGRLHSGGCSDGHADWRTRYNCTVRHIATCSRDVRGFVLLHRNQMRWHPKAEAASRIIVTIEGSKTAGKDGCAYPAALRK